MNDNRQGITPASRTTYQQTRLSYAERIPLMRNKVAQKLFKIISEKQTNVAHNPDVTDKNQFLELVDEVGPHICMLKTHIDILAEFDWDVIEKLKMYAEKHNFLIFEDRKFADIGYITKMQYTKGIYRIAEWADIVTAHLIPGTGILDGIKEGAEDRERAVIVLPRMTARGNFITPEYTEKVLQAVRNYPELVLGVITREKLLDDGFVHVCPGVKLQEGSDHLGQTHVMPRKVMENGVDVILVGRGIYQASQPGTEVVKYRTEAWMAYESTL